jgi:hypothetical protein
VPLFIERQEDFMRIRNVTLAALTLFILAAGFSLTAGEAPQQVPVPEATPATQTAGEACSVTDGEQDPREEFGEEIGAVVYELNSIGGYNCECDPNGYPGCPTGKTCVVSLCYANSSTPNIRGLCI